MVGSNAKIIHGIHGHLRCEERSQGVWRSLAVHLQEFSGLVFIRLSYLLYQTLSIYSFQYR
jgi:hypothetical protein